MNFSSLCEAVNKLDSYGYVVTPSGKLSPVGDFYGHIDFIVSNYDILPRNAKLQIDLARQVDPNCSHDQVVELLSDNCAFLYEILVKAGWMTINTADPEYIYFYVSVVNSRTKQKIANAIVDMPKSVLNRKLSISTPKVGYSSGMYEYDSCREFLRGDE